TALNASSTVGASIRVKVWVDSKRVFLQTYTVGANNDIFITSIGGVPEDAYFRIKIVFRDDLGAHRTVGRFSKLTNCDEEITPTTTSTIPVITTTTLPMLEPTDPTIETGVTTTTLPILEPTDPVDEELEEFEDPLTGEEGNDFFVWDDFDEDLYFTDGSYKIQYYYQEDSLKLAETGIDLDYILISGSLVLFAGLALFSSSRKKKLLAEPGSITIENVYKNSFKLKTKLEKILKEKVLIKIPLDEMNPYGVGVGRYNEKLISLNAELEYTLVAVRNLEEKYLKLDEEITKDKLNEVFNLISNNFDIEFTDAEPVKESFVSEDKGAKKRFFKIRSENKSKKTSPRRGGLAFASLLIFAGLGLGIYATQQMYLTNFQQQNAQEYLEKIYSGDTEAITEIEKLEVLENNVFQRDIPVFENLRDIPGLTRNNNIEEYVPTVFGYLEIPSINLKQYVVSGTDELTLQFGPGHYLQTNLPGSGGNVGIAGHRTTYGAPFSRLDLLEVGDQIFLNSGGNKYHYEIDEKLIVDANEGEYVLYNRGDDRLTLTTCHPKYSARQRLVISGKLFKIESGN
ncbi:class E sortase, partial [Candidatus Actinomarina sp.]|nr:class E sortase [Candidatus Actinomarina sp.]